MKVVLEASKPKLMNPLEMTAGNFDRGVDCLFMSSSSTLYLEPLNIVLPAPSSSLSADLTSLWKNLEDYPATFGDIVSVETIASTFSTLYYSSSVQESNCVLSIAFDLAKSLVSKLR